MLRKFFLSFVLFGLIFLIGCSEGKERVSDEFKYADNEFPPSPAGYIEFEKKKYKLEQGGYEWRERGTSVKTDHAGPVQIAENYPPIPVQSGTLLTIVVEQNPLITSYIWENGSSKEIGKGKTLKMPKEPGRYIYEVLAEWENGEVSYTFVVEID